MDDRQEIMPTNRRRRRRTSEYSAVIEDLLAGREVKKTPENREELANLYFFGWADYPALTRIEALATAELERWGWPDDE
jgi:hypothetical protein